MIWNDTWYIHLLVLAVALAMLTKLVVILKLGLRNIWKKDNKSRISKHLHSTATYFDSNNSLCFKIIDKTNSKFDLKNKEALHINWRKPNLNAQQNYLVLTLSLLLLAPVLSFCAVLYSVLFLFFFVSFSPIIFITSNTNYGHLLLS